MEKLNEFIVTNQQPLVDWYKKVIHSEGPGCDANVPDGVKRNALITLYDYICKNRRDIDKGLGDRSADDVSNKLEEVMRKMGKIDLEKGEDM